MRGGLLPAATLAALVAGVVLVVVVDHPAAIAVGVVALMAFIVMGVFLIAAPELLGEGDEDSG